MHVRSRLALRLSTTVLSCLLVAPMALAAPWPIIVRGSDEAAYFPSTKGMKAIVDAKTYDAVIVGGGLAGMTSALYLADAGKKVLVLEKEDEFGGLAAGGMINKGIRYGRGASYFTSAYEEEFKILERIGMGDYKERHPIHEPSDSYFMYGKTYLGIWEEETLHKLPASFALFKHELMMADKDQLIPNQPFENSGRLQLDLLTASDWIRQMPLSAARRTDPESVAIFKRFSEDPRIEGANPMKDVHGLMELYCRSALGATPDKISAVAFANFYISEIETRYTSETGTGVAADKLVAALRKMPDRVTLQPASVVTAIDDQATGVTVSYVTKNHLHQARGRYSVFAAPLKFAPLLIKDFAKRDPERTTIIHQMKYAHYNVHNVVVKGHPYRATYDMWTRASDYNDRDFCDVILGRWMDPSIKGYEGMRTFKKHPADDKGVLSIYHPMSLDRVGQGYTAAQAAAEAEYAVKRMLQLYAPMVKGLGGPPIEVVSVTTSRWPFSIHVAAPGHFTHLAKILRKPFGHVYFANNNVGTPTFEEALFRGHCAANNILVAGNAKFANEDWCRCPIHGRPEPLPPPFPADVAAPATTPVQPGAVKKEAETKQPAKH